MRGGAEAASQGVKMHGGENTCRDWALQGVNPLEAVATSLASCFRCVADGKMPGGGDGLEVAWNLKD